MAADKPQDCNVAPERPFAPPTGSDFWCRLSAIIWQHHSSALMREELIVCPVCDNPENKAVLDQVWNLAHPNAEVSDAAAPASPENPNANAGGVR